MLSNAEIEAVLPSLRTICSRAEFCLEVHWAKHIAEGHGPEEVQERLLSFPFYKNYEQLTRMELCAICAIGPMPRRVAFIGSGPLPLTSLCLLRMLNEDTLAGEIQKNPMSSPRSQRSKTVVLNIDHDHAAIAMSVHLSMKLGGRGQGMEFRCAEAGSAIQDLRKFDVVYLAALVGTLQAEKEDLLIAVSSQMRPGSFIVVRTSWGLRSCLYPEVDMASGRLLQRLEVCLVMHPYGRVVNSVIIAKVRPSSEMS